MSITIHMHELSVASRFSIGLLLNCSVLMVLTNFTYSRYLCDSISNVV